MINHIDDVTKDRSRSKSDNKQSVFILTTDHLSLLKDEIGRGNTILTSIVTFLSSNTYLMYGKLMSPAMALMFKKPKTLLIIYRIACNKR